MLKEDDSSDESDSGSSQQERAAAFEDVNHLAGAAIASGDKTLPPSRISFKTLEDKATFAYVQVLRKVWAGPQATAFLASSGINAELSSLIIESAHSLYEKDESDIERAISESLGRVLPSIPTFPRGRQIDI